MRVPFVLLALAACGVAAAHQDGHGVPEQILEEGAGLMVGRFTAAQPGPLLVVPYLEGPAACGEAPAGGATVALGDDSAVTFWTNASGLHALLDAPDGPSGYEGVALDTHDAARTLILMQEEVVAFHALVGVARQPGSPDVARTGVLGVPYRVPGTAAHEHGSMVAPEGGGILLDHDGSFEGGRTCAGAVPGHRAFSFDAAALPGSATPGRVVHVVAVRDPTAPVLLPRPLDGTSTVLQANLYLARPGDDAAAVRAALEPRFGAAEAVPLALVLAGLARVARP